MRDLHHITRVSNLKTHSLGWDVTIYRRGKFYRHFFSDSEYGSKKKALNAAKQFRDACLKELPARAKIQFRNIRNKTGFIGISLSTRRTPAGGLISNYVAHWPCKSGRHGRRAFSVMKYGEEEALELAKAARREGLKEFSSTEIRSESPKPSRLVKQIKLRLQKMAPPDDSRRRGSAPHLKPQMHGT